MFSRCILLLSLGCLMVDGDRDIANTSEALRADTGYGYEMLMEKMDAMEYRVRAAELSAEQQSSALKAQMQTLIKVVDRLAWLTTKAEESTSAANNRIDLIGHNISVIMIDMRELVLDQKALATREEMHAVQLQSQCQKAIHTSKYSRCSDVPAVLKSGVYTINPEPILHSPMQVFCDQDYGDGGWTVIQNRYNGDLNFYRDWQSYRNGFGDLNGEFWLGLEKIRLITNSGLHELVVLMDDFDGNSTYARYDQFEVGGEEQRFAITKLGTYTGTAGDGMSGLLNIKFTTFDSDNDTWDKNCAVEFTGAWWYTNCHASNLNGQYLKGDTGSIFAKGMVWRPFRGHHYSLKSSRMLVRKK